MSTRLTSQGSRQGKDRAGRREERGGRYGIAAARSGAAGRQTNRQIRARQSLAGDRNRCIGGSWRWGSSLHAAILQTGASGAGMAAPKRAAIPFAPPGLSSSKIPAALKQLADPVRFGKVLDGARRLPRGQQRLDFAHRTGYWRRRCASSKLSGSCCRTPSIAPMARSVARRVDAAGCIPGRLRQI